MLRPGGRMGMKPVKFWGGKLAGLCARLAGLLHLADYPKSAASVPAVDPDPVERSIRFCRCLIDHSLIVHDLMGGHEDREKARRLWDVALTRKAEVLKAGGMVKGRQLWHPLRGGAGYSTMREVDGGFNTLCEHGYLIEPGDDNAPRRPGPKGRIFDVNPAILDLWRKG